MAGSSLNTLQHLKAFSFGRIYVEAVLTCAALTSNHMMGGPLGSTVDADGSKDARRMMSACHIHCYFIAAVANDCLRRWLCSASFPL